MSYVPFNSLLRSLQSAPISVSSSGDNVVVAGQVNKQLRIFGYSLQATGTVNIKWKNGAVDLTGAYVLQAREGLGHFGSLPGFSTDTGSGLILNLSAPVQVVGFVTYYVEDET